jgi:dTDP-4-dehydrorhamnose reductase
MKILLFGKNGQVGWELQRSLAPLGELVALDVEDKVGLCGDFSNPQGLAQTVRAVAPDVIVNAAAHTAVDKAEAEPEIARTINATAPAALAQSAAQLGIWLVHYSTDYVFDGSGHHYRKEDEATGPLSVYGVTKLEGEQAIRASACKHLVFRTSWVYAARGANFAKTILRLAQERETLSVIVDQVGAPTGAELLADLTAHAVRSLQANPSLGGTYHVVAHGETSWHGYAKYVLQCAQELGIKLKVQPEQISAIPTAAYPLPARRPLNSRLDTTRVREAFGLNLPDWRAGVDRMLREFQGA